MIFKMRLLINDEIIFKCIRNINACKIVINSLKISKESIELKVIYVIYNIFKYSFYNIFFFKVTKKHFLIL